jgi:hypothetical protein
MGRCSSCRNKTIYFCYVNREFICLNCVFQPRYELSVVRSYKEWIRDSSYEQPPRCPFTGAPLRHGEELVRLPPPDLRVVSAAGLAAYLRGRFGPDTTPAGFRSNELPFGLVPDPQDDSAVAQRLRRFLALLGYDAALAVAEPLEDKRSSPGTVSAEGGTQAASEATLLERRLPSEQRPVSRPLEATTEAVSRTAPRTGSNTTIVVESHKTSEPDSTTAIAPARKQNAAGRTADNDSKERKIRQQKIRRFLNFLGQSAEVLPLPHPRPNRRSRRLTGLALSFGFGVGILVFLAYVVRHGLFNPLALWEYVVERRQGMLSVER